MTGQYVGRGKAGFSWRIRRGKIKRRRTISRKCLNRRRKKYMWVCSFGNLSNPSLLGIVSSILYVRRKMINIMGLWRHLSGTSISSAFFSFCWFLSIGLPVLPPLLKLHSMMLGYLSSISTSSLSFLGFLRLSIQSSSNPKSGWSNPNVR